MTLVMQQEVVSQVQMFGLLLRDLMIQVTQASHHLKTHGIVLEVSYRSHVNNCKYGAVLIKVLLHGYLGFEC